MTTPARPEIPMAYYYNGRRIEELSRDELLYALRYYMDERSVVRQAADCERREGIR